MLNTTKSITAIPGSESRSVSMHGWLCKKVLFGISRVSAVNVFIEHLVRHPNHCYCAETVPKRQWCLRI